MGARDRAHEEDDRHDHEPGGDDRGSEADLTLRRRRIPPPAATSTSKKVPSSSEKSRRHFALRVVPFLTRAELERQPVSNALLPLKGDIRVFARLARFGDHRPKPYPAPS